MIVEASSRVRPEIFITAPGRRSVLDSLSYVDLSYCDADRQKDLDKKLDILIRKQNQQFGLTK